MQPSPKPAGVKRPLPFIFVWNKRFTHLEQVGSIVCKTLKSTPKQSNQNCQNFEMQKRPLVYRIPTIPTFVFDKKIKKTNPLWYLGCFLVGPLAFGTVTFGCGFISIPICGPRHCTAPATWRSPKACLDGFPWVFPKKSL